MSQRRVTVLGATGSIGQSTLDLIARNREAYAVEALVAHSNVEMLAAQAQAVGARVAVVADESCYPALRERLAGTGIEAAGGQAAMIEAADRPADWVMAAIVGAAGLQPTLKAIARGATVALANKECLVSAGSVMTRAASAANARLLPVDSEHNAIFQVFDFARPERVRKVTLTASGGPFRTWSSDAMQTALPADAVAHPIWSMGAKISVDSATLMNKGLELIEAFHLFPVAVDQLDVLVHPQSVVHSMVEYVDGSVLAQMGTPDMRTPIAYALAWPDRIETPCSRLDLAEIGALTFEKPDMARFPALNLAWSALRAGGSAPTVLNAANEVAVGAFLAGQVRFPDIAAIVGDVLAQLSVIQLDSLEDVMAMDDAGRSRARGLVSKALN
jgi:1-deoxy-D-xylulose-5-phosphate reductoisomerase